MRFRPRDDSRLVARRSPDLKRRGKERERERERMTERYDEGKAVQ